MECSTTTLTSSPNPSHPGETVVFTATTVADPPASGTPTGVITFVICDESPALTAPLDPTGQTTFTSSSLSTGKHCVTASYSGDAIFCHSTSSCLCHNVRRSGGCLFAALGNALVLSGKKLTRLMGRRAAG
jgi:hypothetical protein